MADEEGSKRTGAAEMEERRRKITDLCRKGLTVAEIAAAMNLTHRKVYYTIHTTPGLSVQRRPRKIRTFVDRVQPSGVRVGTVSASLANADPEFLQWLTSNVPAGATISDLLVACAQDARDEETGPT